MPNRNSTLSSKPTRIGGRQCNLVTAAVLIGSALVAVTGSAAVAETCHDVTVPAAFLGSNGNDIFHGNGLDNTMHGLAGADVIGGAGGGDNICGGDGQDTITGDSYWVPSASAWTQAATPGPDYIQGGAHCDYVGGEAGADTVNGGEDGDLAPIYGGCIGVSPPGWGGGVHGGDGGDDLYGGADAGNDSLHGGSGSDTGTAGAGYDRCHSSIETMINCEEIV